MAIEKEAIKQKCPIFDPLFKRVRTWSPEQQHEFQEYYLSQIAQRNTRQSTELLAKHMEQERHFFYFPFVEKKRSKTKNLTFSSVFGGIEPFVRDQNKNSTFYYEMIMCMLYDNVYKG